MKKLILVFVMWPMMVSVFGQNQRKSITDTVFQLDQAIVKETIKIMVNCVSPSQRAVSRRISFLSWNHAVSIVSRCATRRVSSSFRWAML